MAGPIRYFMDLNNGNFYMIEYGKVFIRDTTKESGWSKNLHNPGGIYYHVLEGTMVELKQEQFEFWDDKMLLSIKAY